jgi:hypothetical protein
VVKKVYFQTDGPVITVLNLPERTSKGTVTISWKVQDKNDPEPEVYVNDQKMYYRWTSTTLELKEGINVVTIKAVNKFGKTSQVTKTIEFVVNPPTLIVDALPETTNKDNIKVSWRVEDENDPYPRVYVNDSLADYAVTSRNVKLQNGVNTITVRAVNKYGKSTEITKTIHFVSEGPTLLVNPVPSSTTKNRIEVSWTVTDWNDSDPKVYVNDRYSYTNYATVSLNEGNNTIVVKAVNRLGQTTEQIFNVQFIPPAPVITLGYAPETTSSPKITLTWTVFDENDDSPLVYVNDQLVRYANSMELSLNPGENVFKIVAGNSYGKTSELIYKVTYTP